MLLCGVCRFVGVLMAMVAVMELTVTFEVANRRTDLAVPVAHYNNEFSRETTECPLDGLYAN